MSALPAPAFLDVAPVPLVIIVAVERPRPQWLEEMGGRDYSLFYANGDYSFARRAHLVSRPDVALFAVGVLGSDLLELAEEPDTDFAPDLFGTRAGREMFRVQIRTLLGDFYAAALAAPLEFAATHVLPIVVVPLMEDDDMEDGRDGVEDSYA